MFNLLPNLNVADLIKAFAGKGIEKCKILCLFYSFSFTALLYFHHAQWKQMIWCWLSISLHSSEVWLLSTTWSATRWDNVSLSFPFWIFTQAVHFSAIKLVKHLNRGPIEVWAKYNWLDLQFMITQWYFLWKWCLPRCSHITASRSWLHS